MSGRLSDPYGSFLPALWVQGWRDRRHGDAARARARWGYVRPPEAQGKVVWIVCGNMQPSVHLGVALLQSIRHKRLDIRLVLTLEQSFDALLEPLQELKKTGWGYGPCDHPRAVKRVLQRLTPFGVIFAGISPRPNLTQALTQAAPHTLVVGAAAPAQGIKIELAYPADEAQARSWQSQPQAPTVDFASMLTEAQVDPNFKTLVNNGIERHLWWLHSASVADLQLFVATFRVAFPRDVLFVSGQTALFGTGLKSALRISVWQRDAIADGSVVWVDETKWLPAVAAVATAVHFQDLPRELLWQAMAGGCAVSCEDADMLPKAALAQSVAEFPDAVTVIRHWREYADNPILARNRGDSARRDFWQERRLAADINQELLQRVFEW